MASPTTPVGGTAANAAVGRLVLEIQAGIDDLVDAVVARIRDELPDFRRLPASPLGRSRRTCSRRLPGRARTPTSTRSSPRRRARPRDAIVAASVTSMLLWIAVSIGFRIFAERWPGYDTNVIATLIVGLIWLGLTNVSVLLGGAFAHECATAATSQRNCSSGALDLVLEAARRASGIRGRHLNRTGRRRGLLVVEARLPVDEPPVWRPGTQWVTQVPIVARRCRRLPYHRFGASAGLFCCRSALRSLSGLPW